MGVAFSRWFQQGTNRYTGTSDWIYTGGYFDRKYSDLPDIYWFAGKRARGLVYLWSLHHPVLIIIYSQKAFFFPNYQNVRHIWIISELSNKTSPTHVTTNLYTGNLELDTTELTELFEIKEMQYTVKQWERLSTCIVNNAQIVAHLIIYHAC